MMNLDNTNNDWEREAPKLAAMEKKNPFSVPPEYFDSLKEHLNSRLFLLEVHPGNANQFTVPEGYFDTLTENIEGRIFAETLKEQVIGNSFTVPEGYFNTLQDRINQKIAEPAKVAAIRKRIVPSWLSYAAAACITIAVSAGLYFNLTGNKINSPATVNPTAQNPAPERVDISDEQIINYLSVHSTRGDMSIIINNLGEDIVSPTDISAEEAREYLNKSL